MVLRNVVLEPYGDHLFLARTEAEWKSLRKKYGAKCLSEEPGSAGRTDWLHQEGGGPMHVVIWINPSRAAHPTELSILRTIAHEAYHAGVAVVASKGHAPEDWAADEPTAYLVDFIFNWIANIIVPEVRAQR